MKISFKLIAQEIRRGNVQIVCARKDEPDALRLRNLMLWSKPESPDPSVCYVADAQQIKPDFLCPPGIALIVLGSCDESVFRDSDADIMLWSVSRREMTFRDQFNHLSSIFLHYNELEQELNQCLINSGAPEELISLGEKMFHNTILLLDASFSLMLASRNSNPLEWDHIRFSQSPSLPADTVEQICISQEFREREKNQGAFRISNEILNCNTLFMQIQRDHHVFYAAIVETEAPITQAHQQMLSVFSDYLFLSLRNRRFSSTKSMEFEYFLTRMLISDQIDISEFSRQLHSQQWKSDDRYICFVLDLNFWNRNDIDLYTICRMVEKRFLGSVAFYHEDRIVCLMNLTQAQLTRDILLQLLATYVRDQLFHVGVSYELSDFPSLPHYYRQALAALEFGGRKHPDEWIYRFEKYALDYFTHYGISKMEPRHLCSPDLIALCGYDRENNTDLLHTLKVYLNRGQNATETAAELYIHRNTLYQRLSKIESLIHGKLENPDTRLYMQLSFSFMDFSTIS